MKATFLKVNAVKQLVRSRGKIASKEFIHALDTFVYDKVHKACDVHNGSKKTLDASVAAYVGIGGK